MTFIPIAYEADPFDVNGGFLLQELPSFSVFLSLLDLIAALCGAFIVYCPGPSCSKHC